MNARELNEITETIIVAAIDVHREHNARSGHGDQRLDCGYRLDLLVNAAVVVEVKAIERFERVHLAQMLSYLKFANCQVGLLLNFNVALLSRNGIKRVVNGFPE